MASNASTSIASLLECPICIEVFKDPRVLPCIHSYCFDCLKTLCGNKVNGNEVPCPVCRRPFVIPQDGIQASPKNFFLARLLEIQSLSTATNDEQQFCDLCRDDSSLTHDKTPTTYCSTCRQRLCSTCNCFHMKLMKSHKTFRLQDQSDISDWLDLYSVSHCDKHQDEPIKLYCFDCKAVSCILCYVKLHNTHKCADVNEVSDEFRSNMARDIHNLASLISTFETKTHLVKRTKAKFVNQCSDLRTKICQRAQELHDLIDQDKETLMKDVEDIQRNKTKQLENIVNEIESLRSMTDSLRNYMTQLHSQGLACDIAREASSLEARAKHLCYEDTTKFDKCVEDVSSVEIVLIKSGWEVGRTVNVVGKIVANEDTPVAGVQYDTARAMQTTSFKVIQPVDDRGGAWSLTVHGDRLFVGRVDGIVEVYDTKTFSRKRDLFIGGLLGAVFGLAACGINNCLYISDYENACVHKVDLSTYGVVLKCDMNSFEKPYGLSVNKAHNLLVCCSGLFGSNTIKELTPNGSVVRLIDIKDGSPLLAVEISTGQLMVSLDDLHCVCLIGFDGQVIKAYGNSQGSVPGQLSSLRGLAVDKHGYVLVAENCNNRILALNSSLNDARQLLVSLDGGLQKPTALYLDEDNGRLYVGETGREQRVMVFEGVNAIADFFR